MEKVNRYSFEFTRKEYRIRKRKKRMPDPIGTDPDPVGILLDSQERNTVETENHNNSTKMHLRSLARSSGKGKSEG